ncbi:MAG: zf-TFIIB domain-containing protein [Anaeromyxobacter sp.]|nr:zf-TFIIB domain-containing protein [Anaeromyxobacter sp.]MBL0276487.1 zf-TFIIB domain-containing protein [Anaeromyxobacter sp.]
MTSGAVLAHRCGRCRGVWLAPEAFQQICQLEERPPGEEAAIVQARGPVVDRRPSAQEERVRYRVCPTCRDVMSRTNFAKVSGVVIDVCRPHGAWFDKGELAAIRRFLRAGGLLRYGRHRRLGSEVAAPRRGARPAPTAELDDTYDILMGGGGWDVPSRIPRLLVAAFFGAFGAWSLWRAFHPNANSFRGLGLGQVVLATFSFYFAWRAVEQWVSQRRR